MTLTRRHFASLMVIGLVVLAGGDFFREHPNARGSDVPRLVVLGSSYEGQRVVPFRVILPETRKSVGYAISTPQVIDATGRTQQVSFIRYATPADEPSLGFLESDGGDYYLQLEVAFEEKGIASWLHRARNCWKEKSLKPLREVTFSDPVSITSDRITNAVVHGTESLKDSAIADEHRGSHRLLEEMFK